MIKNDYTRQPDPAAPVERSPKEKRGKLTVFLGAAAGVGKTYTMLEAARARYAEGVDVAIAWVETHGRPKTGDMLAGMPQILPRTAHYQGTMLQELDIDAVLLRRPELVVIDELAHANIPGSRHVRRFQEDKVAVPTQSEQGMCKFFRPGNINALRELALRFTANHVDQEMSGYMREHRIDGPGPAAGRVMPAAAKLIVPERTVR